MSILAAIRPKEPLRHLRWFDMLIVTAILFGQFAYRSTQLYIASLMPQVETAAVAKEARDTAVTGVAYSENMSLQLTLLAIALIYLIIRRFDFKQLPIRFNLGVLFWTPVIFILMGLTADAVTSLSGGYNYFTTEIFQYIKPLSIFDKFAALAPMAILYGLLNGFYEEFCFLGLLTCVEDKYKWQALAYSTLVRISFHTYQGMLWATVIGVVFGLMYYFFYKYKVKNLLPFFLIHALADIFGSGFIYLICA